MDKIHLIDDWEEKTSMFEAFQEAMRVKQKCEGNPPETIDYSNLKVGEEVTVNNKRIK